MLKPGVRAALGSCLGALLGIILGGFTGYQIAVIEGGAKEPPPAIDGTNPAAALLPPVEAADGVIGAIQALFGTAIGSLIGALVGATLGGFGATKAPGQSDDRAAPQRPEDDDPLRSPR